MPKVKARQPEAEKYIYGDNTQVSSVIFGLVMVVAIIVAGAALLGGSLSQAGKRWGSAMDGVARSVGMSVQSVEVIGLEHAPPLARQVVDAAMILPGENMFRADPHLIRQRVKSTKLVTNVRVYRLWPDTVIIRADAARPSALWHDGERWAVIDSLGQTMPKQVAGDHVALPRMAGAGAPTAMIMLHQTLAGEDALLAKVHLARRVANRRWDLELTNGTLVRLPEDRSLADGVASLTRVEAKAGLTQRGLRAIDLRVPGRVILTPHAPQSAEQGAA
ncbi:MAG: cell division protein FtsQ/DivIB [Pseudomonadota bacterium]